MELILSLIGPKLLSILGGALALVVAIGGVYFRGKSAGAKGEAAKSTQAALDLVKDHKDVSDAVSSLPPDVARNRLRQWGRKN